MDASSTASLLAKVNQRTLAYTVSLLPKEAFITGMYNSKLVHLCIIKASLSEKVGVVTA